MAALSEVAVQSRKQRFIDAYDVELQAFDDLGRGGPTGTSSGTATRRR